MADIEKPTAPSKGSTSEPDQLHSAQRSKMRQKRAESTATRAADKTKETTKDQLKADIQSDIVRPYRDAGAI